MATMLYEGKAKKIFTTENPNEIVVYYKDDATALNGLKKGTIIDKGVMNNTITTFFFDFIARHSQVALPFKALKAIIQGTDDHGGPAHHERGFERGPPHGR